MEANVEDKDMDMDDGSRRKTAQLREQTETVREDIRKLGHLAKDAAQEKLDEARARANEAYERGRARATEAYERGREKATEVEEQVVEYIRAKPLKSVLIAAGVGAFVGILFARR